MNMVRLLGGRWFEMTLSVAFVNLAIVFAASAGQSEKPMRIVAFGDSLTAGFDLTPSQAFPVLLEKALRARGHAVEVINAGVSGDTTAAGLGRFDWAIPDGTDAVILELGANDALRGIDPKTARANLDKILARLKSRNIDVLLAGMMAPRNWGEAYVKDFDAIYPELAEKHGAILYPFFLDGVAMDAGLNLTDGIHPNARGVAKIVEGILPRAEELIARTTARRAAKS